MRQCVQLLPFFDQAVASAGNFATGVILARSLDKTDFGVFVLAGIPIWFALQLQFGLMLNPFSVNGAALDEHAFRRFLRANLPVQLSYILASTVVICAISLLWDPLRDVGLPLFAAILFWQTQEFCRRVLYTRTRIVGALVNNVLNYDLQVLLLLGAAVTTGLTLPAALVMIGGTSAAASLLGVWQLRRFTTSESDSILAVARANLHLGRWTTGSALLTSAASQWYPALVAALAGLSEAAALGVINQLIGPINLLVRPLQNYWGPIAIRALTHEGASGLARVLWQVTRVTTPLYLAYVAVLVLAPAPILNMVYGGRYTEYASTLQVFALLSLMQLPVQILSLELTARRLQRLMLRSDGFAVAITYTAGLYLISRLGVLGAGISMGLSSAGQLLYCCYVVRRARREPAYTEFATGKAPWAS
jgi:O-antigen/teichoic acid export membrane protein